MPFLKRRTVTGFLALSLLAAPEICSAGLGAQALSAYVRDHVLYEALIAFWSVSLAALIYYSFRMVFQGHKDQSYSDASSSFINALIGFVIVSAAAIFAEAFTPASTGSLVTPATQIGPVISKTATAIVRVASGIFVLMATIGGTGMILSQGDESAVKKWEKVLVGNVIGIMIMFVASAVVGGLAKADAGPILEEIRGLALFLLTLIGFLAAIGLIVAGIMLILSLDESFRDRAKKIVIGSLITLAVVLGCYTIIITFL